jgi:signal peptidase I
MQMVGKNLISRDLSVASNIKPKSSIMSWIRFILLLLLFLFISRFVFSITIIDGNSMNPIFDNKDIALTSNFFYKVERNDVVIVKNQNGFNIIKRIIGLPGETVKIENGIVFVNETPLKETYTIGKSIDMSEIKIKKEFYFILGDNRAPGESLDSRSSEIGPIARSQIIGETIISIIPFGIR